MKLWLKGLAVATSALVLGAAILLVLVLRSMAPTKGEHIPSYFRPSKALVIVDIQEDFTGPEAKKPYRDGNRIVAVSNRLLAQAEAQGFPVVYIQNVMENPVIRILAGNVNIPGRPGTAMDRRLKQIPGAPTFTKKRSDAFSNPDLDAFLRQKQVDEVVLVGLDAAYCINATALGALNRGYRVTLIPEGIATESGKPMAFFIERWRRAGAIVQAVPDL